MKNIISIIAAAGSLACASAQTVEQTAGIYYAYPMPDSTVAVTPVPCGYEPFYVSHYGRHGSRWITDDHRYTSVLDIFDKADAASNLTPLGADVRGRLQRITADALGRSGSLSPVGERQHRGIAARLHDAYPQIFADGDSVACVSSTSMRCAMSMAAFAESLKEKKPGLHVSRTAHPKSMDYIAYTSPQGQEFSSEQADWRTEYHAYEREMMQPQRLMQSLFVDPSFITPDEQQALMLALYWIASDMQDVEVGETLYDVFTYDELRSVWLPINARMYVCNADAPIAGGVMKHCADNLLTDIIDCADAALAAGQPVANLRFGHDTHLLRLLALMAIDGATGQATDMSNFHLAWRDYELSPMAANLQMVFFKNAEGDILVKILLNEHEKTVPIDCPSAPYYPWPLLRQHLTEQLRSN